MKIEFTKSKENKNVNRILAELDSLYVDLMHNTGALPYSEVIQRRIKVREELLSRATI